MKMQISIVAKLTLQRRKVAHRGEGIGNTKKKEAPDSAPHPPTTKRSKCVCIQLLSISVALIVNMAVACYSCRQALGMNAAIPTHFCVKFQHTKSQSKPFERFTTSVTQVVNCGKKFNDCGWANKWKWKQVIANSRLIGLAGDLKGWWDNQNSILVCGHLYFFFRFWLLRKPKQWLNLECDEGGHITEEKYWLSWNFIVYTCIFASVFDCCTSPNRDMILTVMKVVVTLLKKSIGWARSESLFQTAVVFTDSKSRFTDKRSRWSLFQTAVVFTLQTARADLQTRGVGGVCFKLLLYLHYRQQEPIYRQEE